MAGCEKGKLPEHAISLTSGQRGTLGRFIEARKFESTADYGGYYSADVVADPDAALNALAKDWLNRGALDKEQFIAEAVNTLKPFYLADTEDRERAYVKVADLMRRLGMRGFEARLQSAISGLPRQSGQVRCRSAPSERRDRPMPI